MASAIAVLAGFSATARAQLAAPVVSAQAGEHLGDERGPRVEVIFAPLWLTLNGGLFAQGSAFAGCDSRGDASGNSVNGFAVQRHSFLRLAPQLVLHRFAMAGCAVDSGSGAALSYAVPLRKRLWLVQSAGFYRQPTALGGPAKRISLAGRLDLVKQLAGGRTLSLGLGTRSESGQFHALNFGGSF
ncbi:MAG TPA: hypothetical protein VJV79_36640 [Polyangiaceae bacterium]|nr:hypothetical protein [Polyangiaceae bacterium]